MTIDERNKLIVENQGLIRQIANRYKSSGKASFDDLMQAGNIGLIQAADKFNPALGYRFSTYAHAWIEREIRYECMGEIPCYIYGKESQIKARIKELEEAGINITPEAIAEKVDLPVERIRDALPRLKENYSLDYNVISDEENTSLGNLLSQEDADVEDLCEDKFRTEAIQMAIQRIPKHLPKQSLKNRTLANLVADAYAKLPPPHTPEYEEALRKYSKLWDKWIKTQDVDTAQSEILFAYYFEDQNFEAICQTMNVSKQCIHQKRDKALSKLAMDPLILALANQ